MNNKKNANNNTSSERLIDMNETATSSIDGDTTIVSTSSITLDPTPSTSSIPTRSNIRVYKTYSQR